MGEIEALAKPRSPGRARIGAVASPGRTAAAAALTRPNARRWTGRLDFIGVELVCGRPTKGADLLWKRKHSAMELALAWTTGSAVGMRDDVQRLLDSDPATAGFVPLDVLPEHVTPLDAFRGEGRNHDLVVLGRGAGGPTLLAIEAKALEPLGPRLFEQLDSARGKTSSRIADRLGALCEMLFGSNPVDRSSGEIADPQLRLLRYQLLTAACGTAIEAARHGCSQAVLLINQFAALDPDGEYDMPAASTLDTDLARFLDALGWDAGSIETTLAGPFALPAPHYVRLHIGKLTSPFA